MPNNWMTEEEAKGKCCQVMSISVAICFLAAATTNRGVEFEEDPSDKCAASRCMHWVWAPSEVNKRAVPGVPPYYINDEWKRDEYDDFVRINPLGGCGLRRLP